MSKRKLLYCDFKYNCFNNENYLNELNEKTSIRFYKVFKHPEILKLIAEKNFEQISLFIKCNLDAFYIVNFLKN